MSAAESNTGEEVTERKQDEEKAPKAPATETLEPSPSSSSWPSWSSSTFTSLLSSAKEKSSQAYEFMKKDLSEFKEAVVEDATTAYSSTTTFINKLVTEEEEFEGAEVGKETQTPTDQGGDHPEKFEDQEQTQVPESKTQQSPMDGGRSFVADLPSLPDIGQKAKSLLSTMFEVLAGPTFEEGEDDEDSEICIVHGDKVISIPMERWRPLLTAVQTDPQTYGHEPDGPPDDYESWLATFNLIDYQRQTDRLLRKVADMKAFHAALVPSAITEDEFWHRYFYRVHQLRQLELRRCLQKKGTGGVELEKVGTSVEGQGRGRVEVKQFDEPASAAAAVAPSSTAGASGSPSPGSGKSSDLSEDWEKAELGDIVDAAAKKIAERMNQLPGKSATIEVEKHSDDWTFE